MPDRPQLSKAIKYIDPYDIPTHYSISTGRNVAPRPEDNDVIITDYPENNLFTDISKIPLFFSKPKQFKQITTWGKITLQSNTEFSYNKSK